MGTNKVLEIVNNASTWVSEPTRNHQDFLSTLFSALDSTQARYCVLHSWERLPQELSSDLDIAVHPQDARKLASVFRLLQGKGYAPAQAINYFVGAYCFRFFWFEGLTINSLAVDVIFKRQRSAFIAPSVELLVSDRRRHGMFWIPACESEFTFLLARKTWKGVAPDQQAQRLKTLVKELGRPASERLAKELFLGRLNVRVVEACANGCLNPLLAQIKRQAWKTTLMRSPLRLMVGLLFDVMRRFRRWSQPTGLLVAVMGPDGAGKSTLVSHLVQALGPSFQHYRLFHWRPMLLWRRKTKCDTTRPHSLPPHGRWWSIARLFAHLLDYWLGYWLVIRPLLARNGFVIFDRYFDDVLIDPKRYRYGGPLWLARIMRSVIPKPDLVLVLDASEEILLSRKQEVVPEEIQRQRRLYAKCMNGASGTRFIGASRSMPYVIAEAATAIIQYLCQRFERQHSRWLALESRAT
jgi:thymidylate kinase